MRNWITRRNSPDSGDLDSERAGRQRAEQALRDSEAAYVSLVENLPLNLFRKDCEGRFVAANQRFADAIGKPISQILGKTDFDFFPRELAEKYRRDDTSVQQTGRLFEDIETHEQPDGKRRYVHVLKAADRDADGNIIGIQGIFWDVTERVQAEAERDKLFSLSLDMMCVAGTDGHFKHVNPAFERVLGFSSEELTAQPFLEFVHPEDRQRTIDELSKLQEGQDTVGFENRYLCRDGSYRWLAWSCPAVKPGEDSLFAVARDITDRKRAELELQKSAAAAEAANRAKSRFLANISHEVRTPLNAVVGMTDLLMSTARDEQQRDLLNIVRAAGESLVTIFDDIMDFSSAAAGTLDLREEPFELRSTIEQTIELLTRRQPPPPIHPQCHIGSDAPRRVCGDSARLRQVLYNLLENALKFTEEGEVVLTVQSGAVDPQVLKVSFEVRDTGPGIPAEKQQAVFEAFEQADTSLSRRHGGVGLGLAITRKLVELMGGELTLESNVGEGSTFRFELPFRTVRDDEADAAADGDSPLQGIAALVVDDDDTNRRLYLECLSQWGMQPDAVAGGEEALHALRAARQAGHPHRLMLVDLHMPDMHGLDLIRRVRDEPELDPVVVLLSSSPPDSETSVEHSEQIATRLTKPVKPSELRGILARIIARHPSPEPKRAATKWRVLLAEDSTVNQKVVLGILEPLGHQVHVAPDGREAVDAFESDEFDVVLMDVQMPEMDGLEATRRIRDLERHREMRTPIIAMTAHASPSDRDRCLAAGADHFLAKPVRPAHLVDAVRTAVESPMQDAAPDPASPSQEHDNAVLNWDEALKSVNGDRVLMADIIRAYMEESPRQLSALRTALENGDCVAFQRAAHTLKGSARYLGASHLAEAALRLEHLGKSGDLAGAGDGLEILENEMERIQPLLETFTA